MATKHPPRPRGPVHLGKLMVRIMTGQAPEVVDDGKDEAAAALAGRAV